MKFPVSRRQDTFGITTGGIMPVIPVQAGDRQAAPAVSVSDPDGAMAWAARALRSLAGVFVVTWSFRLSGYLTFTPWLAIPVVLLGLTGLLVIVAAWLPPSALDNRRQHQIGWAALVAAIAALALRGSLPVFTPPPQPPHHIPFEQYTPPTPL